MTPQPMESRTPGFGRAVALVALYALAAVVVGAVFVLAIYTTQVATRSAQSASELAARLDALTESQKLIVAQLAASGATGTPVAAPAAAKSGAPSPSAAKPTVPFVTTASESDMGVGVAVMRFVKPGAVTPAGWPVTIRYGNYLDGSVGFSVATSRGDIFKGTYYVDESTRTVEAKLLRAAPVTVYGWAGASASAGPTSISAADLMNVISRGGARAERWSSAWVWVKVTRRGEVLAASETPPQ